jgi:GT2 family glycosyltransferase
LLLDDPSRINTCGNDVHLSGLTLCRGLGHARESLPAQGEVGAVSGAAFAIRRDLFKALGGFDEGFFLYMEDTDLSWRARLAGYRCLYVPSSLAYHAYSLRFGPWKTYLQERNRYRMLLGNLRWRTIAVLSPALALAEFLSWAFVLLRDRSRFANKVRAYAWLVGHKNELLEKRRKARAIRKVPDRVLIETVTYRLAYEQTGGGLAPRLAHLLLDPLFYVCQRFALAVVRW